ncbi:MAG: hypothetical protein JWM59_1603 [Verrucomicrobiales bacterium]|nr:hypothetical protein [Verrucomicrobiales bacterium]
MNKSVSGILIGISLVCGGCGPSATERTALNENRMLKERVSSLEEDAKRDSEAATAARASLQQLKGETEKKEKSTAAERDEAKKRFEEVKKAFDDYRAKYRVTARAPGVRIARLDLGQDKVYENVEIMEVTPGELRFHHSFGTGKVALGMLEPALRDRLDYDAEEAAVWMAAHAPKVPSLEEAETETDRLLLASVGKGNSAQKTAAQQTWNASRRKRLQTDLNGLYASARTLQADRNCCPVHKRYQLAEWSREADKLKKAIAAIPAS